MFQLYKQRKFSDLINDTFGFFRAYGKSFIKGYFVINGGLLLALILIIYFAGKGIMDTVFSTVANPGGGEAAVMSYFTENATLWGVMIIIAAVMILVLTLLSHSYPVVFLKLLEKDKVPQTKEIVNELWNKIGKLIVFSLLWMVTFLPIIILISALSLVLFVIIIGIPFALILFSGVLSWMYLALFDYVNTNNGYFQAMKNGFNLLFQNFWHHIGSTAIFYLIVTIIHSIVSFIPYFIGIFGMIADTATNEGQVPDQETFSFLGLMVLITFILSLIFAYVLSNLIIINQGIIYYSAREENENLSLHSGIDLIGRDE